VVFRPAFQECRYREGELPDRRRGKEEVDDGYWSMKGPRAEGTMSMSSPLWQLPRDAEQLPGRGGSAGCPAPNQSRA